MGCRIPLCLSTSLPEVYTCIACNVPVNLCMHWNTCTRFHKIALACAYTYYMHTCSVYWCVWMHTPPSLTCKHTERHVWPLFYNAYSAVPPTIAEATDNTVDSMLTAGQALALTSTAMRTPRPQIDWYKGDKYIANSSRIQINKTEIDDSTLVSALVIPSVTVGDSGTYEC